MSSKNANIKALAQEIQWLSPAELGWVAQQIQAHRQTLGISQPGVQEGILLGAAMSEWAQSEINGE